MEKDILIDIDTREIHPGQELDGRVTVNYQGRFDSIVINSQIERSNDIFNFIRLDGKKINHPYARLSIFRSDIGDKKILYFTAVTKHNPPQVDTVSNAKFRATIIQEHKEVASDIVHIIIKRKDQSIE